MLIRKPVFRTFLLHAFIDYLDDCRRREHAAKPGGRYLFIPLDIPALEEYLAHDTHDSPELTFYRNGGWRSLGKQPGCSRPTPSTGKGRLFVALSTYLQGHEVSSGYVEVGRALGLSPGAVGRGL